MSQGAESVLEQLTKGPRAHVQTGFGKGLSVTQLPGQQSRGGGRSPLLCRYEASQL